MDSYQFTFTIPSGQRDILLAFLTELPFDAFEEREKEVLAYCPVSTPILRLEQRLIALQEMLPFQYQKQIIPYKNWNRYWEANFEPILVDSFCAIRAEFHDPVPGVRYEIVINPKMAFGTGHHATTLMMIRMMRGQLMEKTKVLDYGCGTGILAILAAKMGALLVDAVDIEKAAYDSTIENCQINDVDNVQAYLGGLEVVLDHGYDVILANINRNVILDHLESLYKKLKKSGILLISGILTSDEEMLVERAGSIGFTIDERKRLDKWSCISLIS